MRNFFKGIGGGFAIGIGGCVYLCCENRIVGACAFSVALCVILWLGLWLYTGKVCYKVRASELALGLMGNVIGAMWACTACWGAVPGIWNYAEALMAAKETQEWYVTFSKGFMCEMLICFAVEVWKEHESILGAMICVPVFILCGFEHSIADIFYMLVSTRLRLYVIWVLIGNTVCGLFIRIFNECLRRYGE